MRQHNGLPLSPLLSTTTVLTRKPRGGLRYWLYILFITTLVNFSAVYADDNAIDDLTEMSIEDLMFMEVTSVSKKSQKLADAAAAVYVITQEDIRRSGASSVPEALRMVPGLSVAQLDANKWAISSRGFNHLYANKLLVLVDGRTVYSPLFSGVHWDGQDLMLEDIERIEVVRGPGATLWGANAVNGVINIITERADKTQGSLISLTAGDKDRAITNGRYGGKIGENIHYRTYVRSRQSEHNFSANSPGAADDWRQLRGGFRMDGNRNAVENWMVQGEVYRGFNGETLTTPVIPATAFDATSTTYATDMEVKGADLLGRWANSYAADAEVTLQLYFDTISRKETIFEEVHDTFDIDLQHRFPLTSAQELVWGMGYRLLKSDTTGSDTYSFDPNRRTNQLWSLFIQDEAALLPEKLVFIAGSKVEHNVFTGAEVQPNARLIWTPTSKQSIWSAVSRAVRTPSLNEVDARTQVGAFAYQYFDSTTFSMATSRNTIQILGNPRFESEELTAYEIGYRLTPVDTLSFDIATFYNDYDKLISVASETPYYTTTPAPDHTVMPLRFSNDMTGKAYGVEIAANWQPTARWKLLGSYTYLDLELSELTDNRVADTMQHESPEQQYSLRSYYDLTPDLQFDMALYFVDDLQIRNAVVATEQRVADYTRIDLRLGWRPTKKTALDIGVRNLFDSHHPEFGTVPFVEATEATRNVYTTVTWNF